MRSAVMIESMRTVSEAPSLTVTSSIEIETSSLRMVPRTVLSSSAALPDVHRKVEKEPLVRLGDRIAAHIDRDRLLIVGRIVKGDLPACARIVFTTGRGIVGRGPGDEDALCGVSSPGHCESQGGRARIAL